MPRCQIVQRIARHSNIRLTVDTYGHLDVSDLREAMETLGEATGILPDVLEAEVIARTELIARVQTGVQALPEGKKEGPGPWRFLLKIRRSDVYGACDGGHLLCVRFEGAVQMEGRDLKAYLDPGARR